MANRSMQWNLGGWLGGQLGGSCWMLVAGLLALRADPSSALVVLGLFALANVAGMLIWMRRDSIAPLTGLMILLPILGIAGMLAVHVLDRAGIFESIQVGGSVSASQMYLVLIGVVAGLMLMFWLQFGRHR